MKEHFSAIEALESRIAPAGVFIDATSLTVTVKGGVVSVAPATSDASVQISIEQLPNGDFLISDADGDDDLEETADFTGTISGFKINTGAGDDTISLALRGDAAFAGAITINTGAGDDSISFTDGFLKGPLTITTRGTADIQLGGTGEALTIKGAVKVDQVGGSFGLLEGATTGALTVTGADFFELTGSVLGNATLKALTSAGFAIGAEAGAPKAFVQGSLTVLGSGAEDQVELAQVLVGGALNITLGNGDDSLTADVGTTVTGITKIVTNEGLDTVALGTAADAGPKFYGNTTVTFAKAAAGSSFTAKSGTFNAGFTYVGSANDDSVFLGEAGTAGPAFNGKVSLALDKAHNELAITSGSFGAGLTVKGGLGDDNVTFGALASAGPSFHGNVALDLGASVTGNQFNLISALVANGLSYAGGAGADTISIGAAAQLFASLNIKTGGGANTVNVATFSDLLAFNYTGGADVDILAIGAAGRGYVAANVKLGGGADSLTVAPAAGRFFSTFSADGGAGTDTAAIPSALLGDDFLKKNFEV